jgi:hypothetical protein
MPKVPQPTKTPASISPALWQNDNRNDNREEILTFLDDDYGDTYLFYEVMKNDPDPESSAIDRANAAKVDTITRLQKAQFLAQADSMHLDETTQTPVKKKPDIGDKQEIAKAFQGGKGGNISFQKFPTGVYGHNDLQKGLYILLGSSAISGASSTSANCTTMRHVSGAEEARTSSRSSTTPFRPEATKFNV